MTRSRPQKSMIMSDREDNGMDHEELRPSEDMKSVRRVRARWLAFAPACVFYATIAPGAEPAREEGRFSVTHQPDSITVRCNGETFWKAVVDRKHGGAIRHFSLAEDAPSIVAVDNKEEGADNPFRGMFNLFYMTRIDRGEKPDDRVKAKGTIWKYTRDSASIRVVSQDGDKVVVEATGRGFGWRLLGPDSEAVVEYRQTYTFREGGVTCEGEFTWVYPHDTRLSEMSLESFLAPSAVAYPLRAIDAQGRATELPISTSKGHPFPEGVAYPLALEVSLRNGHRLRFRTLQVPRVIEKTREYFFERPWQQGWAQGVGFIGDSEQIREPFPAGAPVCYRYEMLVDRPPAARTPPRLTITSPEREGFCRLGETLRFSAVATDEAGRPMPDDKIRWEVFYPGMRPAQQSPGGAISYVVPAKAGEVNGDILVAMATVTAPSGRTAQEYVKINVDTRSAPVAAAFEWREATPESQGMSPAALDALWKGLLARHTTTLLVVRNDRIVSERYADGWDASKRHGTASMAKALVGGVALALAVGDGRMTLDDRAEAYIPAWKDDPIKSRITVRQLGSHTSGLDDAKSGDVPHEVLPGWKGAFWRRAGPPGDPFTIARDVTPLRFEPGTEMLYSNLGIGMIGYVVTAALKDAPRKDIRTLLRDRVMRPIGVPDEEWSVGYGTTYVVDGLPLVATWGGGSYTPRAVARVARLMLRGGDWDGTRLIDESAVRQVTRDAGTPGSCGMGWWANADGAHPRLPADAFFGSGAGHQVVLVVPSLGLIAVRNGESLDTRLGKDEALDTYLFNPLVDAITGR
jgi:CubicO group peptidase (beta-lactamase class C family)